MPFVKGQSGNPGGRLRDLFGELVRSKKGLPDELFNAVYPLLKSKDENMVLKAVTFIKESGWGKSIQQIGFDSDVDKIIVEFKS